MGYWSSRYYRAAYSAADYWNGAPVPAPLVFASSESQGGGGGERAPIVEWCWPEWMAPTNWEVDSVEVETTEVSAAETSPEGYADHASSSGLGEEDNEAEADETEAPPSEPPPFRAPTPRGPAPDPRRAAGSWRETRESRSRPASPRRTGPLTSGPGRRSRSTASAFGLSGLGAESEPEEPTRGVAFSVADQEPEAQVEAPSFEVAPSRRGRRPQPPTAPAPPPAGRDRDDSLASRLDEIRAALRGLQDTTDDARHHARLGHETTREGFDRARGEFVDFAAELRGRRAEEDVVREVRFEARTEAAARQGAAVQRLVDEISRFEDTAVGIEDRIEALEEAPTFAVRDVEVEAEQRREPRAAEVEVSEFNNGFSFSGDWSSPTNGLAYLPVPAGVQVQAGPTWFQRFAPYALVAVGGVIVGLLVARAWKD